jgi:hypothetical protein
LLPFLSLLLPRSLVVEPPGILLGTITPFLVSCRPPVQKSLPPSPKCFSYRSDQTEPSSLFSFFFCSRVGCYWAIFGFPWAIELSWLAPERR